MDTLYQLSFIIENQAIFFISSLLPLLQSPPPSARTTHTPVCQWKHPSPQPVAGAASSRDRVRRPAIFCSGPASA